MYYVDQSGEKKNLTWATGRTSSPGTRCWMPPSFGRTFTRTFSRISTHPEIFNPLIKHVFFWSRTIGGPCLGTNEGRLGLQPPYGSLVVSSPTSSSFKSVPPWHYVILCQLPMINLKLHRSETTWPPQIIVIIHLHKLGSTILTHQSQDGSMSVFRKAESLTYVPLCQIDSGSSAHTAESISHACCKKMIGLPNHPTRNKEWEKKWLLHRKNPRHSSWVFSGDMTISPGHCKPMGTVTVFKTCTACITASWKHKKFWPLPLMIWVHP